MSASSWSDYKTGRVLAIPLSITTASRESWKQPAKTSWCPGLSNRLPISVHDFARKFCRFTLFNGFATYEFHFFGTAWCTPASYGHFKRRRWAFSSSLTLLYRILLVIPVKHNINTVAVPTQRWSYYLIESACHLSERASCSELDHLHYCHAIQNVSCRLVALRWKSWQALNGSFLDSHQCTFGGFPSTLHLYVLEHKGQQTVCTWEPRANLFPLFVIQSESEQRVICVR